MEQDKPPAASVFDPPSPPTAAVAADTYYALTKQVVTVPQTEQAIKAVLSNNQSVALGFSVYESFESPEVAKTGVLPMPTQGEQLVGGHEVLAVGYLRSEPHYVLAMNSWGTDWGLSGFFLMPWSYITNRQLVRDLRTIVRPL
jgi:C1A family cysteine protease